MLPLSAHKLLTLLLNLSPEVLDVYYWIIALQSNDHQFQSLYWRHHYICQNGLILQRIHNVLHTGLLHHHVWLWEWSSAAHKLCLCLHQTWVHGSKKFSLVALLYKTFFSWTPQINISISSQPFILFVKSGIRQGVLTWRPCLYSVLPIRSIEMFLHSFIRSSCR